MRKRVVRVFLDSNVILSGLLSDKGEPPQTSSQEMTMRFLADESYDFALVRALRRAGFDVLCISESTPRAEDLEVIGLALREERILLSEDKRPRWPDLIEQAARPQSHVLATAILHPCSAVI